MTEQSLSHYLEWSTRGHPAIWRYVLVVVLTVAATAAAGPIIAPLARPALADPTLRSLILTLAFLPGFIAAPLLVRLLLGRPAFSIALPAWPGRWREFFYGVLAGWIVLAAAFVLSWPYTQFNYHGFGGIETRQLLLALPLLFGFFIQTGFEEFAFRGLLMQATNALTKSIPIVLLVQAIAFGALHIPNLDAYGGNPLVMVPYLLAALVFGWAAWRSGSLLLAMGMHFANNSFLTFFISMEGDVIGGTAPLSIATHTLTGVVLFGITQAALEIVAIELLARRGIVGPMAQATAQTGS